MINRQALEDNTAVLEIQQGACNSCSPTKVPSATVQSTQRLHSSLHFSCVHVGYLYLARAKEDISI